MNNEIKEWIVWGVLIIVGAIIWRSCESSGKNKDSVQEVHSNAATYQPNRSQNVPISRNNINNVSTDNGNYNNSTITVTESSTYSVSLNNDNSDTNYANYEETSDCIDGVVVYEGENDYYIIETRKGCSIVERYSGRLYKGDKVRGELNNYNYHYIINYENDSEVKVYIGNVV